MFSEVGKCINTFYQISFLREPDPLKDGGQIL